MAVPITDENLEYYLNQIVTNNSSFGSFVAMLDFVESIPTLIVETINDIVDDNTVYNTFAVYLQNNMGIDRDEIRESFRDAILKQSDEMLGADILMKSIMLNKIFSSIIQNRSGDMTRFNTMGEDEENPETYGKYYVESD